MLYLSLSFVLPVIIALLFALVEMSTRSSRFLRRRLKIWEPVSAFILVIGAFTTLLLGFYMLESDPISKIVTDAPRYAAAVEHAVALRAGSG